MKHDDQGDWWREDFEQRLRRDLTEETRVIRQSGDALARIRTRTATVRRRSWWRPAVAGLVAAGVAAAVAITVETGRSAPDGDTVAVPPSTSPRSASPTPSTTPPPTPTPRAAATTATSSAAASIRPSAAPTRPPADGCRSPGPTRTRSGALYWVSRSADPRLYREFVTLTSGTPLACDTLQRALTGRAVDPDYATLWPSSARVEGVTVSDGAASVTLSAGALARSATAAQVRASVQQLVFTVTAATGVDRVRLLSGGAPVTRLWGHGIGQLLTRSPLLDVQAQVWILDPTQGARTGSPVQLRVVGTGFEGNVVLVVTRGTTEVARTNVTTADSGFAEASASVRLAAGAYTVRAYNEGAKGLREQDSKAFTVR